MTTTEVNGHAQKLVRLKKKSKHTEDKMSAAKASHGHAKEMNVEQIVTSIENLAERVENGNADYETAQAEHDAIMLSLKALQDRIANKAADMIAMEQAKIDAARQRYGLGPLAHTARRTRRARGAAGSTKETADKIVAHIKANKLTRVTRATLMEALGLGENEASAALRVAVEDGMLRKQGVRRGTSYDVA